MCNLQYEGVYDEGPGAFVLQHGHIAGIRVYLIGRWLKLLDCRDLSVPNRATSR
jgi:hypothetical protein